MAKKARSPVLAAWLNRQAQPQADGTHLVRPFSLIPFIYQVDTATKGRWVRFQLAYRRFALIAMLIFFVTTHGKPWALTWGLVTFVAIILLGEYAGLSIVLREAKRVSRDRWQGPLVIDRFGNRSRRYYLVMMILALLLDAVVLQTAWTQREKLNADAVWGRALLVAVLTASGVFMLIGYRRTAPKGDSPE